MFKNRRVFVYILSETIPSFLLGVFIFICVLLMFQSLRLTEFLLVHGIKWTTLARIMGYMSISFLPMLLPMSLLFAILLTYNRFSLDSEIIALKACQISIVSGYIRFISHCLLLPDLIGIIVLITCARSPFPPRQHLLRRRKLTRLCL